jgi:hypothetical protein
MNILKKANEIIFERSEEKERQYGPIDEQHEKADSIASILCNKEITTEDFYKCMIALKLSRMAYSDKEDTMLDLVAYTAAYNNFVNDRGKIGKFD